MIGVLAYWGSYWGLPDIYSELEYFSIAFRSMIYDFEESVRPLTLSICLPIWPVRDG